jgi:hypothetical protein
MEDHTHPTRTPGALNLVLHRGPAVHVRIPGGAARSARLVAAAGALGLAAWRGRLDLTSGALVFGGWLCLLGRPAPPHHPPPRRDWRLDEAGIESFPASDAPATH